MVQHTDGGHVTRLLVERNDLAIRMNFSVPLWPLVHNIPKLYSALLLHLRDFGVNSLGIRSDSGDGSIGSYNVNFWVHGFKALVKIRLESAEFQASGVVEAEIDLLEHAFVAVARAIENAYEDVRFSSYAVTLTAHGRTEPDAAREYLRRFVPNPPALGPLAGCGAVFYYGDRPPVTLTTVAADLSGIIADGLMLRVSQEIEGSSTVQPTALRGIVENDVRTIYGALRLTTEEGRR